MTKHVVLDSSVQVERLADIQKRLAESGDMSIAMLGDIDMDAEPVVKKQRKERSEYIDNTEERNTQTLTDYKIELSVQNGWVNAKFSRARILHEFLLTLVVVPSNSFEGDQFGSCDTNNSFSNSGIIETARVFEQMTFEVFVKCIGVWEQAPIIDEFIKQDGNMNMRLNALPNEIREFAFGPKKIYKFKRYLLQLVELLKALQLIESVSETQISRRLNNNAELHSQYRLLQRVPLKDYRQPGRPLLRYCTITSIETAKQYWVQLEYICIKQTSSHVEILSERSQISDNLSDLLQFITLKRNWVPLLNFSSEQREVLESHCNRKKGTTPLGNMWQIKKIAEEVNLTIPKVCFYFKRIEDAHQRRLLLRALKEQPTKARRQRKKKAAEPQPEVSSNVESNENLKAIRGRVKKIISRTFGENISQGPANEALPVVSHVDDIRTQYNERHRFSWTPEEDKTLLYAYVVSHFGHTSRFLWNPVEKEVAKTSAQVHATLKGKTICKNRVLTLMKSLVVRERIEKLIKLRSQIYEEGLQGNFFQPVSNYAKVRNEMDIGPYVEFVKNWEEQHKGEMGSIHKQHKLLLNVGDIENMFTAVADGESESCNTHSLHISLRECQSSAARIALLNSSGLTCNFSQVKPKFHFNHNINIEQIQVQVVKTLIKMILLTPDQSYDAKHAWLVLNSFPQPIISTALQDLRKQGTISTLKGGSDRHIPGRAFLLSDKFLNTVRGLLPDKLITQATVSWKDLIMLTAVREHVFSPFSEGGVVASVLDLLVSKRMLAFPRFQDFQQLLTSNADSARTRLRSKWNKFAVFDVVLRPAPRTADNLESGHFAERQSDYNAQIQQIVDRYTSRPETENVQEMLQSLFHSQSTRDLAWKVFNYIGSCGPLGALSEDLKENFDEASPSDLKDAIETMRLLHVTSNLSPLLYQHKQ
ncbi:hypothetical protein BJ742DRAFT_85915 [Cladochytrium replicatum]|nr:hypothetical protein BJ742DRAFT_85915 [Cladochytrium replicatum]